MELADAPRDAEDIALLRRFEPILRFTAGEMFVPSSVEAYLDPAKLLMDARTPFAQVIAEGGELTPDSLAAHARDLPGVDLSLCYVERGMGWREHREWLRGGGRNAFKPISRAAAVGLISRLIAVLVQLSLLVRGRVPGGWTAAAAEQARAANPTRRSTYYGRVSRDAGYIALQYWFLYPMNDWRSSYGGVNDHEADWEQVTVFLTDTPEPEPAWVAFSSHDEEGADLRRRWDDPDLTLIGEHPVVFVGAGSHSGAYLHGEYLVTVRPDIPHWLENLRRQTAQLLGREQADFGVGIPYIDYRRGDGLAIGPGQDQEWDAHLIDDDTPWVRDFRGLWGLDTRDRFGGERAPAGPRYERDGTVRQSWRQPIAWADLDRVPPSDSAAEAIWAGRAAELHRRLAAVETSLETARAELRGASVADGVAGQDTTSAAAAAVASRRVEELRAEHAALSDALEDADRLAGLSVPTPHPHSHLQHRALPLAAVLGSPVLGVWAALSAALLMATLGVLLVLNPEHLLLWSAGVIAGMFVLEAVLRGRLFTLVTHVLVTAAVLITAGVLVALTVVNLRVTVGVLLLVAAAYLLVRTIFDATRQWLGQRAAARRYG
ncbi:MAG: NPP1 family protein [Actinomycetota bacterium]